MIKNIKLGIIGYNKGNGHPYSYSAIFNGFNKKKLNQLCPYPLIKEYLHKRRNSSGVIKNASITHIWTQNYKISKKISEVSKIKYIVKDFRDLLNKVDGIILARDDHKLNFKIIKFFLKNKVPIFVDKQFAKNTTEFNFIKNKVLSEKLLFHAGSAVRFSNEAKKVKMKIRRQNILSIYATSRSTWLKYAHHVLEPLVMILGTKIKSINKRKIGAEELVELTFKNNVKVFFYFSKKNEEIGSNIIMKNHKVHKIVFKNYYSCFKNMLKNFIDMIRNKKNMINMTELFDIAEIVLRANKR